MQPPSKLISPIISIISLLVIFLGYFYFSNGKDNSEIIFQVVSGDITSNRNADKNNIVQPHP